MNDFPDKTTDELRHMAACLRHPDAKERRKEVLAEILRREMRDTPIDETATADVLGPPDIALPAGNETGLPAKGTPYPKPQPPPNVETRDGDPYPDADQAKGESR